MREDRSNELDAEHSALVIELYGDSPDFDMLKETAALLHGRVRRLAARPEHDCDVAQDVHVSKCHCCREDERNGSEVNNPRGAKA